jgi:hypothetical protein
MAGNVNSLIPKGPIEVIGPTKGRNVANARLETWILPSVGFQALRLLMRNKLVIISFPLGDYR